MHVNDACMLAVNDCWNASFRYQSYMIYLSIDFSPSEAQYVQFQSPTR